MEYGAEPISSAGNSSDGVCRRRRHSTTEAEVPIKRPRLTPEIDHRSPTLMWYNGKRLNLDNYRPMCPIIEISLEDCDNEEMDVGSNTIHQEGGIVVHQEGGIVDENRDEQNMEE